jgi:alpha-tubulin suppressor-like RCC1 family protein
MRQIPFKRVILLNWQFASTYLIREKREVQIMAEDSRRSTRGSFRMFVYLGMLLLMPMAGMAENDNPSAIDCSEVSLNAGDESDCSVDLSDYPGVSSIRYEYVLSSTNSETISSVMDTGAVHTCGILENGSAMCWGRDTYGQLGDGGEATTNTRPNTYVDAPNDVTVSQIFTGPYRTCAILSNDVTNCWGFNEDGQSGDESTNTYKSPTNEVNFPEGRVAKSMGMGNKHTCAILDNDQLACWGADQHGALGNGDSNSEDQYSPVIISTPADRTTVKIDAGVSHTCILMDDGGIMCWGRDNVGQLGNGESSPTTFAPESDVILPEGRVATDFSVGNEHSCAILDNDSVVCWGMNNYGQLGDNSTTNAKTPTFVHLPNGSKATRISSGSGHTCATIENGSLYCWGHNKNSRLGIGTSGGVRTIPTFVSANQSIVKISASAEHTCVLSENGSISCWGRNNYGQLGLGHTGERNTPNQLDWNSAPFSSIYGPAPIETWGDEQPLRGRVTSGENDVWNVHLEVPETIELGTYDLEITLLKIGGIRSTLIMDDALQISENTASDELEEKTMMYMAIGGGVIVLILLSLMFKKKGTESPERPETRKQKPREGPSQKF